MPPAADEPEPADPSTESPVPAGLDEPAPADGVEPADPSADSPESDDFDEPAPADGTEPAVPAAEPPETRLTGGPAEPEPADPSAESPLPAGLDGPAPTDGTEPAEPELADPSAEPADLAEEAEEADEDDEADDEDDQADESDDDETADVEATDGAEIADGDDSDDVADGDDEADGDADVSFAFSEQEEGFRSGFVTLVGRPNVGKSTLLNQILGQKVAIVSDKPQTTRHRIQGVLNRPGVQIVFVDTPGLHKPRTALGERLNDTARSTIDDVDVVVFVLDATQPFGRGDTWVAERVPRDAVVVVNKVDVARRPQVAEQLARAGELDLSAYFPVSARTGEGVDELVDHLVELMPEGPRYFPEGMVTDVPEAFQVAELVREQLLAIAREELPHSIATRVTEWEWPYIRCEILVERPSQKVIVVGRGGEVLKQVGIAVREQLPSGAYLDLRVKVDRNWQRRPAALDRLGF